MSDPLGVALSEHVAAMSDELLKAQREINAASQAAANATVTRKSKDRLLTVEVGTGGQLKEIKFHGTGHQVLAPAELAAVLIETINAATTELAEKVRELMLPHSGLGTRLRESLTGGTPLDQALESVQRLLNPHDHDDTWEKKNG